MSLPQNWKSIIAEKMLCAMKPLNAHTFIGFPKEPSTNNPVILACDDGESYYVKNWNNGDKSVVTEQVVAFIGALLNAPIPPVRLINVPQELLDAEPENLWSLTAGICHGSQAVENVSERAWIDHVDVRENHERFARLAVLFGLVDCGHDPQFLYSLDKPHIVWSVDHGRFFPGGPNWTIPHLEKAKKAEVFDVLAKICFADDINSVIDIVAAIVQDQIAQAIAVPPESWPVTMEEREMLASFLEKRRRDIAAQKI